MPGELIKIVREYTVLNKLGLHARPASLFVKTAIQFSSDITISKGGHVSNGKSILELMMLAAGQGASLSVMAHGKDAAEALDAIGELITSRFGED